MNSEHVLPGKQHPSSVGMNRIDTKPYLIERLTKRPLIFHGWSAGANLETLASVIESRLVVIREGDKRFLNYYITYFDRVTTRSGVRLSA